VLEYSILYYFIWIDRYGKKLFISDGISKGKQWGTFCRNKKGSLQRIKSPDLPMVDTKLKAQNMLNQWAHAKGYKQLCVYGKIKGCLTEAGLCCRYCDRKGCLIRCRHLLPCFYDRSIAKGEELS